VSKLATIKNNIAVINYFSSMMAIMEAFVFKCYKHFRSIVIFFSFMVYNFFRKKIAPNDFLDDKPMFKHITFSHGERMARHKNNNISATVFFVFFKSRMILSRKLRAFYSFSRARSSLKIFPITFTRTIFSVFRLSVIKRFIAYKTDNYFSCFSPRSRFKHFYLLTKKAAFEFLTDSRLSVSTLLTALILNRKSVNPLDKAIIT